MSGSSQIGSFLGGSSGGAGTGTASAVTAAPPGTVNLTTEGTFDWLSTSGAFSNGLVGSTAFHAKKDGGWLINSIWGRATGHSTSTPTIGPALSSTAADDRLGSALSSVKTAACFFSGDTTTDFGFTGIQVPLLVGNQRVIRIYGSFNNLTTTVSWKFSQSGNTGSITYDIGAVQTDQMFTITATGGTPGDVLVIDILVTTNHGSGSITLQGITVAAT